MTLPREQWPGAGPVLVLLHAGVADRRSWRAVGERLAAGGRAVVAYDRRGFGEAAERPTDDGFTHLADLEDVLDAAADGPAWLVGCSMGGELALDAALAIPERLAGVALLAPSVSGAAGRSPRRSTPLRARSPSSSRPRRASRRPTAWRRGSGSTARASRRDGSAARRATWRWP